jgi:prolyl-tRNA editing enzyme YbaK/EbsC (Cys-tRNA(Pro) deacylase)
MQANEDHHPESTEAQPETRLSASAQKVQDALAGFGLTLQVVELPTSTRTSAEAAQAVGCQVGQIAKSLIFKAKHSKRPILVIASGANRVNEQVIAKLIGEPLEKAEAGFVRQRTGFAIGGVPPVGHLQPLETFIDQDLLQYNEVWAAAGTPQAVFRLKPDELLQLTNGQVVSIH